VKRPTTASAASCDLCTPTFARHGRGEQRKEREFVGRSEGPVRISAENVDALTETRRTASGRSSCTDSDGQALVVGAARGIGAASALALARDGRPVLAADVEPCDDVVRSIRAFGGDASAAHLDIADTDATERFFADPAVAGVRAVVIAASILGPLVELERYPREAWDRVVSVNLTGVFFCARAAANHLAAAGGGRIVLFGSPAGRSPVRTDHAAYIATKAAIRPLVAALTSVYDSRNVRIAAVEPGRTRTPMIMGPVYGDETEAVRPDLPVERILEPDDIASVVAFLCSDRADAVTNAYWPISSRT
jgi:NAD(P)-dependent dehydrogenase (short-subunit alcohol dehydrogenase family)